MIPFREPGRNFAVFCSSIAAAAFLTAAVITGCTPEARQDVGKAGVNLDQAVDKSAAGTAAAIKNADVKLSADKTVQSAEHAVDRAGADFATGAKEASADAKRSAAQVVLTPSVREAITSDTGVSVKNLNVDTVAAAKKVIVYGEAASEKERARVLGDAHKALADAKSTYTVENKITISGK